MGGVKSRRGVYYDLSKSPYEYKTPYGDLFKFSSAKKLQMYTRDIPGELDRFYKLIERHEMGGFLPDDVVNLIVKSIYRAFYHKIEG